MNGEALHLSSRGPLGERLSRVAGTVQVLFGLGSWGRWQQGGG